jgi:hypothetical protein
METPAHLTHLPVDLAAAEVVVMPLLATMFKVLLARQILGAAAEPLQ